VERDERFAELYRRHHRAVWAYAVRRVPAGTDAADVAAEVFAIAWRRRDRVPPEPETLLWLYATARRVVANTVRAAGRRDRLTDRLAALPPPVPAPDYPDVLAALDRLGEAEREAIRLAVWEDLTVRDIATVLGCSPNAVSLRLARARRRLGRELSHLLPAEERIR
jgi:RNA polymerase sigma factor (sigma-70 family)